MGVVNSLPSLTAGKQVLARLLHFGPRKKVGVAVVVVSLAVVWFLTGNELLVALLGALLLTLLLVMSAAVELRRWRNTFRRRVAGALKSRDAQQRRADKALLDLRAVRSELDTARKLARDDRTWRDIRAGVSKVGTRQRTRVFVFPMSGVVNAYLKLIYQEFPSWGFDVLPMSRLADLDAAGTGDVVHYHWTKQVQRGCSTAAQARSASDALLDQFRTLQQRGVTIVWGVHETLPHECPFPDIEIEFRQSLVDLVDVVQILHPLTNAALEGAITIPPGKTLVVPHPLYTGAQADRVTRAAARADLGYGANDVVLLGIGSIRPYKGYERVIRMLPSLQAQLGDRQLTFVIAGAAQQDPLVRRYVAALETEIALLPDPTAVRLVASTVPENYLQVLLRCADVSVAPYHDGLNSGVLLMNMTFGVPTVIASNVIIDDIAQFGPVSTFPADDDAALRQALLDQLTATSVRPVDPHFIEAHSPTVVSAAFAQALRARLRRTDADKVPDLVVAGDRHR